jgi:hypothetical protein
MILMVQLQAGFGRSEITPDNLGFPMIGYGNRKSNSTGIHDPLWAKALVVRQGDASWALCSLDLCYIDAETVAEVRRRVSEKTQLQPEAILIATTHTHSGPLPTEAGNWNRPFAELVSHALLQAWQAARPARVAQGAGFLVGHSLNRRWLDRPVDPGVGVLRVDDDAGQPLGVVTNFACHPVVLGSDNYLLSADYVGYATDRIESELGGTCIFVNGGCGDINPLTGTVRQQMAEGRYFTTMARGAHYYGQGDQPIAIGNRGGGLFAEAEEIGHALAHEVLYVTQGLATQVPTSPPWHGQARVNHLDDGEEYLETQALGIGDFALVTQPGEVFAESALDVKAKLRALGYRYPWLVSYANDWHFYLVPAAAFPEGGYEVDWAVKRQHSTHLQDRFWQGIAAAVQAHAPYRQLK